MFIRRLVQLGMLLIAGAARADVVADWADITTEIATDGPNTIRTMALAQSAVYEAVNAITARYPKERADLGSAAFSLATSRPLFATSLGFMQFPQGLGCARRIERASRF